MKKFLGLSLALSLSSIALAETPAECQLRKEPLEKDVSLGGRVPEYFFKPIWKTKPGDTRDEVSLISSGSNYTMDMKNGEMKQIPGPYDGVPTPDGQFIVVPEMQWMDRDTIGMGSETVNATEENRLSGVYHSMGVLNSVPAAGGGKTVTYRAITDTATGGGNLMYKEYTFKIAANGNKSLVTTNGAPQELCSNLGRGIKTPIIAKNGKMLSAYNIETGTTQIFDIVQVNGRSECKTKKDMGFATSKMEFSPDGKKVVFAMNSLQTTPSEVQWYSQPPTDSHNMNIFTYDLATNDLTRFSNQQKGNAYYPSFSDDGKSVLWMSQNIESGMPTYSVKRMKTLDGKGMKSLDFSKVRGCDLTSPEVVKLFALGKLWESVCSQADEKMTMSGLATMSLAMTPENCTKLVKNNWNKFKSDTSARSSDSVVADISNKGEFTDADSSKYMKLFLNLTQEQVLATCNTGAAPTHAAAASTGGNATSAGLDNNPTSSCTQCHNGTGDAPKIPFGNPAALGPWKKKALLQVMTGNMPKNMILNPEQRDALVKYLRELPAQN